MALRTTPHGEDFGKIAGGDASSEHGSLPRGKRKAVAFTAGPPLGNSPASPPGEGKYFIGAAPRRSYQNKDSQTLAKASGQAPQSDEIENQAQQQTEDAGEDDDQIDIPFLQLGREAEATSARYANQVSRRAWTQSMLAYNNRHFTGSKYTRTDWRHRSKFFRPKTRTAVKKDLAAVAASLFGNIDAVSCMAGNESDPRQRAAAAVMEELVNYRTDRSSGNAAISWFQVAMGARQDSLIAGICLSKQYWKFEVRRSHTENGPDGERDVYVTKTDRPECDLIPPENFIMDPAADWRDPVQSAQYVRIKWPMPIGEIKVRQNSPINPWLDVAPNVLMSSSDTGSTDTSAIRRARELGLDRLDESQTGSEFQIIWIDETYMRVNGEDYTYFSVGDRAFLTEPAPTREVYPEQFGDRPLVLGYGNLDAHRVYPMSPVESWQQHQGILNDIANLQIDAVKQNVMPVSKIIKGKGIDVDQVKKRSHGTAILMQSKDDLTFDRPQDIPQSVFETTRGIELELDDLAGQFNGQTTQASNALGRTLGGLKLVAGSANAVQEYDIRVWIETWTAPVLAQIVRLEQYYEHDDVVLGLCGDRAKLMEKFGVNSIDDALIEQEVVVRVSVGLGAGDPQQRLQKFSAALQIVAPIIAQSPEFTRGEKEIDTEAICEEVFGGAGYRDGGARFFKQGQPKPQDPLTDLKAAELKSKIAKNTQTGKAAMITALAAAAKQALGERTAEADMVDQLTGRILDAIDMGHQHGQAHNTGILSAMDHGHRHGLAIRGQQHQERQPQLGGPGVGGMDDMGTGAAPSGGGGGDAPGDAGSMPPPSPGAAPGGSPQGGQPPADPNAPTPMQTSFSVKQAAGEPAPPPDTGPSPQQSAISGIRKQSKYIEFVRDAQNRIMGMNVHDEMPQPAPAAAMPPPGPPPMPPGA